MAHDPLKYLPFATRFASRREPGSCRNSDPGILALLFEQLFDAVPQSFEQFEWT